MKILSLSLLALALSSCSSTPTSHYALKKETHLKMKSIPTIGKTASGQELYLGGFSGLILKDGSSDENLLFSAITDRGPNGWNVGIDRPFLMPDYSPQIVNLKANLKDNTLEVVNTIKLKKKNSEALTGLPNIRTEENPIDTSGFMLSLDKDGMDTEAITPDGEGGYWIGEEYAPSLAHFNAQGVLQRRLTPFNELPKMYAERKPNRGFEGISKVGNLVYGFLQSPLPVDQTFSRIVEVDLETMKTSGEYFYYLDKDKDRIGDVTSLGNKKFLIVEQNGKKGDAGSKAIYKITLNDTDTAVTKEFILDLGKTAFKNVEKVEGLTLIDNHRIALVNDNDFQISSKTDPKTGITPLNQDGNEMLVLEFSEDLTK